MVIGDDWMNSYVWDLSDLFRSDDDFYQKIEEVKKLVSEVSNYEDKELDSKSLLELLNRKQEWKEVSNKILVYGSLKYYQNIKSKECIQQKEMAESLNNKVDAKLKVMDSRILELGWEKIPQFMKEERNLKIYKHYLDNLFRMRSHVPKEEVNLQIMENRHQMDEEVNLYNKLVNDITYEPIEVDNKQVQLTSSNISKYLSSRDREIRKQTFFSLHNAFYKNQEEFANILDSIYHNRVQNAHLEKYSSVLEQVLFEENIDLEIINTLIEAVHANVSCIQNYLKLKAKLQKIEDPHLYDFNVPLDSNLKIRYSLEEATSIIKNALRPLGEEYLKVVEVLLNGHMDVLENPNKYQFLTFSWHTYSFMNFKGSYVDIKNMIHELGHIVNYYLSMKKQPYLYEDSTIFVGETASIVNEILLNRYLYQNAKTKEEKMFYLSKEIENYFTSVFKQTMYTEYERKLYEIAENGKLTKEILSENYQNLTKKYYGEDIIYDEEASIEWARLGHLYRWSYYPYQYATGLLMASVVVHSLVDKKTLTKKKYLEFLSSGSSKYSFELLKILNIDLCNGKIIKNGFKILERDLEELFDMVKKDN